MEPLTITHQVCLTGGNLQQRPWVLRNLEMVEGRQFWLMNKSESGFSRLITGVTQNNPLKDYVFFDELRTMRNNAMLNAPQAPNTKYMRNKLFRTTQMRCMTSETRILEVHVPKIEHEGEEAPATVLRFKRTDNLAERVSIEIDPGSLNYIRLATLQRGKRPASRSRPHKSETPDPRVKWWARRKVWMATRKDGMHRSFRPDPAKENHYERKLSHAVRWCDGDSELSGSDAKDTEENAVEESGSVIREATEDTTASAVGAAASASAGDMNGTSNGDKTMMG